MRPSSAASSMAWKPSITEMDGVASAAFGGGARDLEAGTVARHMHDAGSGVRRFTRDGECAVGIAIERGAVGDQIGDAGRGFARDERRDSGSQRPAPAAIVSAACACHVSPGATAAAMPPCAQTLDPVVPGRAPQRISEGKGASLSAVNKPGKARA